MFKEFGLVFVRDIGIVVILCGFKMYGLEGLKVR